MAQAQFEGLLTNLMSEDNASRVQAEKIYQNTKKQQPNEILQALLQVGRTSTNKELRSLAIVLLRRALVHFDKEKALWNRLSPAIQTLLKEQLLQGVISEEVPKVRADFCEAVVGLAGDLFDDGQQWEGFVQWLVALAQSTVDHQRQSALSIISDLCHHLQEPFSGPNFAVLGQLIQSSLASPQLDIKIAALNTAQSVIVQFPAQYRKEMQNLLPSILDTLAACLNAKDEDSACKSLENLINLTEQDPGFFQPAISVVVGAMLNVCNATQLEDSTRQLALEFLLSIAENKPKMCTSVEGFAKNIIYVILQWMMELPEVTLEEWNQHAEEDDDEIDIENYIVAQQGLDRICIALPAKIVGPIVLEHIPTMIQHQDWRNRYVGAMAVSMIGEGCSSVLKPHLAQVVSLILPLFSDPHPRVRWAAANTAGQMATDFGPKLQKQFHADFLPRMAHLLSDNENPKVQSHVAAALVNWCEKLKASTLKQYLPTILNALHTLLKENRKQFVTEQVVTAIASVAGCAEKHFTEFYDIFMPILKDILMLAKGADQTMLRGKAMECISLIGIAVGKEKFGPDVPSFMEILANIKTLDLEAEDPLRDFVLQTWMRVASCLAEDFVPYLSYTMPQVLQSAALEAGFSVSDSSLAGEEEEDGWDAIDIGDTRIRVHTVALEEKASACSMLLSFASEMKDAFFPYVQDVSKLILPLLNFGFHDGVRSSCAALVPHLLNCVKAYLKKNPGQNPNILGELFRFLFPALLESIRTNGEMDVQLICLEALHESLAVLEYNSLNLEEIQTLTHDVFLLTKMSQTRRQQAVGMNPDADRDDSAMIREELKSEDDMMVELAEVVGSLVKYHPDFFMETLKTELLPLVGALIQRTCQPAERQFALCFFDDIVEHGKEKSFPYWELFMPFMLEYATDAHEGVRQAACYGLGVCAQQGQELFKPYARQALEILLSVISKPDSREDDNAPPTENAISSVGKIIVFQESQLGSDVPELIKLWLSWLPIEIDDIEAKAVHKHLFGLIIGNHKHIFGADYGNLPKILSIFANCLREDTDVVEDKKELCNLFKQMQQQMGDLITKAVAVLPADQQALLSQALAQ
eukprot:TRINITY_DN361_c0_g1_i1.p1 TRINITY_DN361_c0_g1~~TRINITY_DN361_c0_g1_i1.p1  ORF type:complete len:1095 (-),score=333.86 TRINITY_DN361_c0_g1_i1:67-3351(-)